MDVIGTNPPMVDWSRVRIRINPCVEQSISGDLLTHQDRAGADSLDKLYFKMWDDNIEEDKEMGNFIKLQDGMRINADQITRVSFQLGVVCVELTDAGIKEACAIITMSDGHNIEVGSADIDALHNLVTLVGGSNNMDECEYVMNWVKHQMAVNKYSKKEGK